MSAELALQKAVRTRLVGSSSITALVPAANILDRNARPNPDPSIILGAGLSIDDGDSIARDRTRVVLDLHVWKKEPSTAGVKAIGGAIRSAIRSAALVLDAGFHAADCRVSSMRFLRDPDGLTSHAVVTVEAIVQEVAS
jgi:hypothetical protein